MTFQFPELGQEKSNFEKIIPKSKERKREGKYQRISSSNRDKELKL